jgi:hypothetical protein
MRTQKRYIHDHEGFTTFFGIKPFAIMDESSVRGAGVSCGADVVTK